MPGVNCVVSTMGYFACLLSIEDSSAATAAANAAAADAAVAGNIAAAAVCKRDKNTCYCTVCLMIMITPAALPPCLLGVLAMLLEG